MNGIVKYNPEDVAPIVMYILSFAQTNLIALLFGAAVEGPYKDLKGLVDTGDVDDETCTLLNMLEDKLTLRCSDLIGSLNEAVESMANVNHMDTDSACWDENLRDKAEEIYWSLIFYTSEAEDLEAFYLLLSNFLCSLQEVFYWVLQLVQFNELDHEMMNIPLEISFYEAYQQIKIEADSDFTLTTLGNLIPELLSCFQWVNEFLERRY